MHNIHGWSPSGSSVTIASDWSGRREPRHRQRKSGNATPIGRRFMILTSAQLRQRATAVSGNAERSRCELCTIIVEFFNASAVKTISFGRCWKSGNHLIVSADFIDAHKSTALKVNHA